MNDDEDDDDKKYVLELITPEHHCGTHEYKFSLAQKRRKPASTALVRRRDDDDDDDDNDDDDDTGRQLVPSRRSQRGTSQQQQQQQLVSGSQRPDQEECEFVPTQQNVSFLDISGQATAKQELLAQYIFPVRYPGLFRSGNNGVMLFGPPGTGKTLLAKAASRELGEDTAFLAPTMGALRSEWEGGTEKAIESVFSCARNLIAIGYNGKRYRSVVVFFDEFDSLAAAGREKDASLKRSVNVLLQEMDGFSGNNKNVSVVAATNFPSTIDASIRRRFGAEIFVDLPDAEARAQIVLNELTKHYVNHGETSTTTAKDRQSSVLSMIAAFSASTDGGIDDAFIKRLVRLTGMTELGARVVEQSTSTPLDEETAAEIASELRSRDFGYSGSDLVKMVSHAVRKASVRALKGYFVALSDLPRLGYSSVTTTRSSSQPCYLYAGEDLISARKFANDRLNLASSTPVSIVSIPSGSIEKVYNYTVNRSDFEDALKAYPPTTNPSDYLRMRSNVTASEKIGE